MGFLPVIIMSYNLNMGYDTEELKKIGERFAHHLEHLPEEYWDEAIDMYIDVACQEIAIGLLDRHPTLSDFAYREQYILFSPAELAEIKAHIRNTTAELRAKYGERKWVIDPNGSLRV